MRKPIRLDVHGDDEKDMHASISRGQHGYLSCINLVLGSCKSTKGKDASSLSLELVCSRALGRGSI